MCAHLLLRLSRSFYFDIQYEKKGGYVCVCECVCVVLLLFLSGAEGDEESRSVTEVISFLRSSAAMFLFTLTRQQDDEDHGPLPRSPLPIPELFLARSLELS